MKTFGSLFAPAAILALVAGCSTGEKAGQAGAAGDGGTLVVAAPAEAETLLPPVVETTSAQQVVDLMFEHLAAVAPGQDTEGDDAFDPQAADSWAWSSDSSAVTFHLNQNGRWHDGRPLVAADVGFSYDITTDPVVASFNRTNLPKVDSIATPDSFTVRFHFVDKSPERFYRLVTNLWLVPKHLLDTLDRTQLRSAAFARNPVGSGPFRFSRWDARSVIEVVANTGYPRGRPHLDRVVFAFSGDLPTASNRVAAGEADFIERVRPETQAALLANPQLRFASSDNFDLAYLLFNLHDPDDRSRPHPILGDRQTRLALGKALDRASAVRSVYDTLAFPALGPFVRAQWAADTTLSAIPFDTAAASRTLDSLGWKDSNGDGIRDRGGKRLQIGLAFPAPSSTRRRLAVVFQEQWKRAGVEVALQELDPAVSAEVTRAGKFDTYIQVVSVDASPSVVAQHWGGRDMNVNSNPGRYANPRIDSLMAAAAAEKDRTKAKALYRETYQGILDDVPAVFLFEPRVIAAVHKRFRTPPFRADGWWKNITEWSVPAEERIDRDNVGLPAQKP